MALIMLLEPATVPVDLLNDEDKEECEYTADVWLLGLKLELEPVTIGLDSLTDDMG